MRLRKFAAKMLISALLTAGISVVDLSLSKDLAQASAVTVACRSADGTGSLVLSDATKNGFYQANGIRITPVFSKRMYVDVSRGFDATYIAYRVTNISGGELNNLTIELTDFQGSVVMPATDADTFRRIGTLASGAFSTAYFFIKATSASSANHRHNVRVNIDDGINAKTQRTACFTDIEAVDRSLSTSANKVTSITTPQTAPALGSTFDVTVIGAPGKVGSGETPDNSILALSPASYSAWPSKSIRLENVELTIRAIKNNTAGAKCLSGTRDGVLSGGQEVEEGTFTANGNTRFFTVSNRLVLRGFSLCATDTKQTYEVKYRFRVISAAATNPAIRPLASISSGTQIKYTGSLPSVITTVPISDIVYPITVDKTFVSSAKYPSSGTATRVDVTYRITATTTSGTELTFEEFRDDPPGSTEAASTFQSATFTDNTRTNQSISKVDSTIDGQLIWRFIGSPAFQVSSAKPAVLEYVVSYPVPAAGTTADYTNLGFVMQSGIKISSSGLTTGIKVNIEDDGDLTPTTVSEKSPQTISFGQPAPVGLNSSTVISATADSSLLVSFSSDTPEVCSVAEQSGIWYLYAIQETNLAEGRKCTIRATQAGDAKFAEASPVLRDVTILRGQVITATNTNFSSSTASISVSATSKLPVDLVSLDPDVCTVALTTAHNSSTGVSGWTATAKTTGACILLANQAGGDNEGVKWGPAPEREIRIGSGTAQTLRFLAATNSASTAQDTRTELASGTSSFQVFTTSLVASTISNATPTKAGLPVALKSLTPLTCRVVSTFTVDGDLESGFDSGTNNTTLTVSVLAAGTCTLEATQDGLTDAGVVSTYAPATPLSRSYLIRAGGTTAQVLAFESIDTQNYGDPGFTVRVASSKADNSLTNLLVQIGTSTPTICEVGSSAISSGISSTTVYLKAAGSCSLTGTQPGDNTYLAASASTSFTVNKKVLTVTGLSIPSRQYDGSTTATISGTAALSGVVPGDSIDEIRISGTPSIGSFSSANVGSQSFTVSDLSILGTKSTSSYQLSSTSITGAITERLITVSFLGATVAMTPEVICLEKISVTSGSLVEGHSITAITCDLPSYGSGYPANAVYTVTPSAAVIKQGSSPGTDRSANYTITYQAGTLSVSGKLLATVTAPEIVVVYGQLLSSLEELASTDETASTKVKARGENNSLISGQVKHKKDNLLLNSELPVATESYEVVVEFIPDNSSKYATVTTTRKIKVVPRPVKVSGPIAVSKQYDGTQSVSFDTSKAVISAVENNAASGIVSGDASFVSVTGSPVGEFTSSDVGDDVSVTVTSGLSLTGSKASNYSLQEVGGVRANITQRPITVSFVSSNVGITPEVVCLDQIAVTSGTLVAGQVITSISCNLPSYGSGYTAEASYTVTPSSAVIRQGGPSGTSRTSNYLISYQSGQMTISEKELVELAASDLEVVYGELYKSLQAEAATSESQAIKVKARGKNNTLVPGEIRHKKGTSTLSTTGPNTELDVGAHDVLIEFVPDEQYQAEYATKTSTRKVTVLPRPVRASGLNAISKQYNGSRSILLAGNLTLAPVPTNSASGIIEGDTSSLVDLDGVAIGELESANAGQSVPVSVTGLSLKGSKAGNYALQAHPGLTVTITKKPLKLLVAKQYAKLKGDPDPNFSVAVDGTDGFVEGESLTTIGGASISRASGQSTEVAGTPIPLTISTGSAPGKNNYDVEVAEGVLHISDVEIVVETGDDGAPSTVTCNCANLKNGEVVTLTMYSDPTVIATTTVTDGTCPFARKLQLPDAEGNHTLELTSQFPNGEDLTQRLPISFMTTGDSPPIAYSPGSSSLLPPTLVISETKFKKATASWLPASGEVASYRLYIDGQLIGSFDPSIRTARIPGLKKDTLYRATLVAVDRSNQSAYSQADFWTRNKKQLVVYFSGDSPKITSVERKRISALVRSLPENYLAEITVVATVKRIPGRSFISNKALADARANNVSALLKRLGLKASFKVVGVGVPESDRDRSRKAASRLEYVRII